MTHRERQEGAVLRAIIVEDDEEIRNGMISLFESEPSLCLAGAFDSAERALRLWNSEHTKPADRESSLDSSAPRPEVLDPTEALGPPVVDPSEKLDPPQVIDPSEVLDPSEMLAPSEILDLSGLGLSGLDLVLMDIELPGMSGIEATRQIRRLAPEVEVVMLTVRDDEDSIFDALCAGAIGYLLKTTPPRDLVRSVHEAVAGGAPLSPRVARRVATSFRKAAPSVLTEREVEILRELCRGRSYKEIGHELFISFETVHSHIKSIYRKLAVRSKNEAVAKAIRKGWV